MADTRVGAAGVEAIWRGALVLGQVAQMESQEKRLNKIADNEQAWAEFLRDRYRSVIVGCEDRLISSICSDTAYKAQYSTATNRIQASIRASFAGAKKDVNDCQSYYCIGAKCGLDRRIAVSEAAALADAVNQAYRYEEAKELMDEEKVHSRLVNVANLGRGFMAQATASQSVSASLFQSLANATAQSLAGNLMGLGYNAQELAPTLRNAYNRFSEGANYTPDDQVNARSDARLLRQGGGGEGTVTGNFSDTSFDNAEAARFSNYQPPIASADISYGADTQINT